ncbi:hypothetical protein ACFL0Z_02425 [Patescibacteria group bacterium]
MGIHTKVILVVGLCAAFMIGGAFAITSVDAAIDMEDAASVSLDNTFTGITNYFPKGIQIGNVEDGGVTQFNGTIINEGGPVTFGDDVRIDGKISRRGSSGDAEVWIENGLRVDGGLKQSSDSEGLLKIGINVKSNGSIEDVIDNTTNGNLEPTVTKTATGTYVIRFPYYEYVDNRYIVATPVGTATAPTAASVTRISDYRTTVRIVDVLGNTLVDQAFTLAVF